MKVLIADKLDPTAAEILKKAGHSVDIKEGLSPEEINNIIGDYDGVIVRSATKIREAQINAGKNLKAIARAGIGVDNIDCDYAKSKGIGIINTPGVTSISVAELVIGHMFALPRHIAVANASITEGKWEKSKFSGTEIFGKTLGVLGMGRIGQEVAKRGVALGMKVIGYDVVDVNLDFEAKMMSFDDVIKNADYISLHMPYDKNKGYVISTNELNKMKKGAYIINAARGGVLDENALLKAINDGHIKGAGLDVFEGEPELKSEIRSCPQIVCTPHIGAATDEGQERAAIAVAERMNAFLAGDKSVLMK